ncbi:uncharacterized protein LOC113365449 [Ctenocephalides felis]|uniref:uncharacterized protein LOC113365449 n=1 Tax=Ctenocephalides felis TaxID=7515 RepID=UPI000E6E10DA|nr:uncharacterized protein LOC113365449 [Ctenocephalides felis]
MLWSDSKIVLAWIKSPSRKWKTFVANRVSEIQTNTDPNNWYHVRSEDNPADLISRGMLPEVLINSDLWWFGPSWLNTTDKLSFGADFISETEEEIKHVSLTVIEQTTTNIFNMYSSYTKLVMVIGYCVRFLKNCKNKAKNKGDCIHGELKTTEINDARVRLIKLAQRERFKNEIESLSNHEPIKTKSDLKSLNPFLDENGILRVGGRIKLSDLGYDKRHPMVLPKNHALSSLIARYEHIKSFHSGAQHLLHTLRETYWPINGRNLFKGIIRRCVICFKVNPTSTSPLMGDLPKNRVTPHLPFTNCGVDFGGPIMLRDRRTRGYKKIKGYICLFICFSTRAIHLELVSDLTSECFLATLRRFIARRGKPTNIYSDNGTNFVGASSEIKRLANFLRKTNLSNVMKSLSDDGINWHFIPAKSPHFGGIWEAGIKSCKSHLKRILGNACLTFEDFYTILAQIEAILNSRPISPLSSDPNDLNPLTPGHFLIGKSLTSIPDPNVLDIPENRLGRYQHLQRLAQHFWKRWHKEYISELQSRTKRTGRANQSLKVGTMVLLREDNVPPLNWQLGRIIEVHPGLDKEVRVVTVKVQNNVFKRAATKVCALPIDNEHNHVN